MPFFQNIKAIEHWKLKHQSQLLQLIIPVLDKIKNPVWRYFTMACRLKVRYGVWHLYGETKQMVFFNNTCTGFLWFHVTGENVKICKAFDGA